MMSLEEIELPNSVHKYLMNAESIQIINEGKSGAHVYKLTYHDGNKIYLKYDTCFRLYDRIADEVRVLEWLHKKLKVPEVLLYEKLGQLEFLLTVEVKGILLSNLAAIRPAQEIVKLYAEIVNEIHSIDICGCPFNQTIETKMANANLRICQNDIDVNKFDLINQGFTPKTLFRHLEKYLPSQQHLVFTHGDLYMNNILVDNNGLAGIIDWARGGYCDYHYDISIILHNIKKYLGSEYKMLFLNKYKTTVDENLIDYYWKLNEFF